MLKLGLLLGCVGLLGGATANNTIQSDIVRKNASFNESTSEVVYTTDDLTNELGTLLVDSFVSLGYNGDNKLSVTGSVTMTLNLNGGGTATDTFTLGSIYSMEDDTIRIASNASSDNHFIGFTISSGWNGYKGQGGTGSVTSATITIQSATFYNIAESVNNQINMPSATDLFSYITQGVTGFIGSLGQAFTSVVALFWDSTASGPTFVGLLMLLAIGAGLIYLAIRFVMALVRRLRG